MKNLTKECENLLDQTEKLLRKADNELLYANKGDRVRARKIRTGINDACNALHRASKA